jgi:hypothetical protein
VKATVSQWSRDERRRREAEHEAQIVSMDFESLDRLLLAQS